MAVSHLVGTPTQKALPISIQPPANSINKTAVEADRNYVLFDEKDIKITAHVLYQSAQQQEVSGIKSCLRTS